MPGDLGAITGRLIPGAAYRLKLAEDPVEYPHQGLESNGTEARALKTPEQSIFPRATFLAMRQK